MAARAIVDTGFLVALLDGADRHHAWAIARLPSLPGPWLTAESCISELVFLLERARDGRTAVHEVFRLLASGAIKSAHLLPEGLEAVRDELVRYRDRWVDFADACVVRLSDLHPKLPVVTIDERDFRAYFRRRRRRLITPS